MTEEMPSTKPNIIMTARLLLIPVFKSVELKPVPPWARAERVLRVRMAATGKSDESRERTLRVFVIFIALTVCCFLWAALPSDLWKYGWHQGRRRKCMSYDKGNLRQCAR